MKSLIVAARFWCSGIDTFNKSTTGLGSYLSFQKFIWAPSLITQAKSDSTILMYPFISGQIEDFM